ncbi:MAG: helix-turn-helix transcriptional regulator [Pseudomonadota bacterium]
MDRLDSIIRKIYDAALDPTEWEALLAEITSAIGAVAGFYAGLDIRHGRGAFWYTVGHDERVASLYNEHYLSIDPTLAHIIKSPGKAFACSEYLSDADVAASRFHSEFMIPNGIRYVLSGVVSMQGSMVSFFGFQRHVSQPPFTQIETDFLQRLIPHFAKADQVAAKVSTVSDAKRLAMAVLDRMDYGIVIVNQAGHVRMTNQRAEQLLQAGEVIQSVFGRIRLTNTKDNEALCGLARNAAAGDNEEMHVGTIETTAENGNVRVRVAVLPISHAEKRQLDDDEAHVVLVLSDSNQQRAMASHVLKDSYGLTVAETKVATGLAGGQTQDELSESLFVSLATIKTHTQHIYQKIGVSRQVDLVRLVYGLPALF